MSNYDDPEDDEDYFSEVDEGDDTGKSPKFVKMDELNVPPAALNEAKVDDLFEQYISLRNQLSTDRRGYKAREARIKQQMLTISSVLLNRTTALGVSTLGASTGTGYRQEREKFKVAPDGWQDLTAWVRESGNFQVLQKRVSPDAVKEVREETGQLPPGIEPSKELTFVVRSPSVRKSRI